MYANQKKGESKKQYDRRMRNEWIAQHSGQSGSAPSGNATFGSNPSYLEMLNASAEITNNTNAATFAFNANEAEKERIWSTAMSGTSHQREVADLKAAGLNPVLSANGGAAAYTGAAASSSSHDVSPTLASIFNTKSTNANQLKQTKMTNATNMDITAMNNRIGLAQAKYGYNSALAAAGATRYAADANLAAAATSAEAQKEVAKINQKTQKWVTKHTPQSNPIAIFDRWINGDYGPEDYPGLQFNGGSMGRSSLKGEGEIVHNK